MARSPLAPAFGVTRAMIRFARRYPLALAGCVMLALVLLGTLAAPLLTNARPARLDVLHMLNPPSLKHPCGTDLFGRDVFARVLFGARYTLAIGLGVVLLAFVTGVAFGTLVGFVGGAIDMIGMRLVDALLSFPALMLAIALAAALGPSLTSAMLAIAITLAPQFARVARGQAMQISGQLYVQAARCLGISTPRILLHYVIRNGIGPLLTLAPLSIGSAILQTASLGFLGLGAQPPTPEWGADIAANLEYVRGSPWVVGAPGIAILLTVLSFNLIGDAITQSVNPRRRSQR